MDLAAGIINWSGCGMRDFKSIDDEMRLQVDAFDAVIWEEYGV